MMKRCCRPTKQRLRASMLHFCDRYRSCIQRELRLKAVGIMSAATAGGGSEAREAVTQPQSQTGP